MLKDKKTQAKKLTLTRETVRKLAQTLSDEQLRAAAGGRPPASNGCGSSMTAPC